MKIYIYAIDNINILYVIYFYVIIFPKFDKDFTMQKNITEFFNNLNELSSTERAALSHCVRKYLGEDQIPGSALAGFYKSLLP